MGAKYMPSHKDVQANQRYQEKLLRQQRAKKLAGDLPPPPAKKK